MMPIRVIKEKKGWGRVEIKTIIKRIENLKGLYKDSYHEHMEKAEKEVDYIEGLTGHPELILDNTKLIEESCRRLEGIKDKVEHYRKELDLIDEELRELRSKV